MKNNTLKVAVSMLVLSSMVGCGVVKNYKEGEKATAEYDDRASTLIDSQKQRQKNLKVNQGIYLAPKVEVKKDPFLLQTATFSSAPVNLDVLSSRLADLFGRPVRMAFELPKYDPDGVGSAVLKEQTDKFKEQNFITKEPEKLAVLPSALDYTGTVEGLLNVIASTTRTAWSINDDGGIVFSRYQTKVFYVNAIPGNFTQDAQVGGSSGGSTTGVGSSGVTASVNIWTSMEASVKSMLTTKGTVSVSPATGSIVVTDTVEAINRIESFIKEENANLSAQVYFDIQVVAVSFEENDQAGWNLIMNRTLDSAWNKTRGETASTNFSYPSITGAGNLSYGIIKDGGNLTIDGLVQALSTNTKVSRMQSASQVVQNNQPYPLQVADEISYLASITSSMSSTGTVQSTLTPGKVVSGFSMNILPRINMNSNDMLLQISMDMSTLTALNTATSGNNSITTPNVAKKTFLQRVMINSGDTLVLTGFEKKENNLTTEGMGDAEFYGLGGGKSTSRKRDMIVVFAKPVIVKR
jgi:type IVB pilus formation R64 PilN family outer membrane protein